MVGDLTGQTPQTRAVERLQQLGLKQNEALCFVSLATLSTGTARDISDHVEVPRSQVYESVGILEQKGLIEVHHSSPQQFRAIPMTEAVTILRDRYAAHIASLDDALTEVKDTATGEQGDQFDQEVWSLSDTGTIRTRTQKLISTADSSISLIIGAEEVISDDLLEALREASGRDVDVIIGAVSAELTDQLQRSLPDANVFESELYWLQGSDTDDTVVGRFLLVDDTTILASTLFSHGDSRDERAVYGTGFGNSIVVIARRLLATGLELEAV